MILTLLILMLIVLGMAANRWGVNSIDGPYSPEWERRQRWYGFHDSGRRIPLQFI